MTIQKLCKNCMTAFTAYNTIQRTCAVCSYNKLAKPRKPIKRQGKVAKQWIKTRKDWIEANPPDENGLWTCYLQIAPNCPKTITLDALNIEHKESRARRPDLRNDINNLGASCQYCNALKGSRSATEVQLD